MPWRPDGGPLMQRSNRIDRRQVRIAITQGENRTIKFRDHTQQAKAELEYDKFKALAAHVPRPVDADFEQATKDLKKLPKPKKPKLPKK